ncbi:OSJNBa0080E14.14 protein, related [Eimeria necatrix]|uniref:OSJNBa0080E14.14 protein, related n=1 Tax=Eimeria necatrix TaxID=51315 RepID=U6MGV7_9EIME|nr:OSJNBa0080E14.14 protein, related [Eimeria necatrix]CDJ63256.1 OSJNBa0080E14.14 protein, related [Eimeria necatrix]
MMCAVATGPNAIPVSFERRNRLLSTAEGTNTSKERKEETQPLSELRWKSGPTSILSEETPDATTDSRRKSAEATQEGHGSDVTEILPHWWRETYMKESYDQRGALCCVGAQLRIDRVVTRLTLWCGHARFSGDFLVGPVPYDLVLGLDWLTEHKVAWYFQSDKLRTYVNGQWCELPVVRTGETTLRGDSFIAAHPKTPAEQAYEILANQVAGMSTEEAAIFLRPPPRRYKPHAKKKAKARITSLVRQAAEDTKDLKAPMHSLHLILALSEAGPAMPLRLADEWQGALCCAVIGTQPASSSWHSPSAITAAGATESDEESPWPQAQLEHTLFDAWIHSTEAQDIPQEIAQVLHEYRAVFPDNLPKGLPPKRPHDHHILLAPGKLPAKSTIYRMTPDQLTFHKQEIAKLSDNGWIGPTYSPICSPTIMVDKRDDGSGERKMRMVVNYQALNALTIAPEFPLPPIQTILEMLGGAQYFSTLDLEAG